VEWTDTPRTGGPLRGTKSVTTHFELLPPPALAVRRLGPNTIRIAWPGTAACRLECRTAVSQAWTVFPTTPAFDDGQYGVVMETTTMSSQFFRLAPKQAEDWELVEQPANGPKQDDGPTGR
jgi:hypothetical protein